MSSYSRHDRDKLGGYRCSSARQTDNFSNNNGASGCSRGGGHPAGLRGKAIGLYYRNQARKNMGNNHRKSLPSESRDLPFFFMDTRTENEIWNLLKISDGSCDDEDNIENNYSNDMSKNRTYSRESQFKRKYLALISGTIQEKLKNSMLLTLLLENNQRINEELKVEQKSREARTRYQNMMEFRCQLPSFDMKDEVLKIISENQVVVISGETGCGKTTQVPQFILDDAIENDRGSVTKIICTQPRRISAISVAERVAAERDEILGKSVGYQIRLERVLCRDYGSIVFCTTGILLQLMQNDPALRQFSHIVLDEIHERNTESDFIITLLKQVISVRPSLKIILMSATLNADTFSKYYENCPNVHIPGYTYPVTEYYLEDIIKMTRFKFPLTSTTSDHTKKYLKILREKQRLNKSFKDILELTLRQVSGYNPYPSYVINELKNPISEEISLDLIQSLVEYICDNKGPGAILIFLPGLMDILNLTKQLLGCEKFSPRYHIILPLHSRLPTSEQKLIFEESPPGVRKIVVATSIAETSITIKDVVYVIDCGKIKMTRFDIIKDVETLEAEWISLANAKQRRGRAGRVQPGECYRLYTRTRETTFDKYPTPEMLRTPLHKVILQVKILQLGRVDSFLSTLLDPPTDTAIKLSLELLQTLDAIDKNENLTPLGYHLARLPLDPRTGKMIIWAAMFSCVEPVFAIAASLSFKDGFYTPIENPERVNKAKFDLGLGHYSDHIALAEALRQFECSSSDRQAHQFCSKNFLSWNTLNLLIEMKSQFAKHLYEIKFLDSDNPNHIRSNRNSNNMALIKAIVCAGLFPNIAVKKREDKFPTFRSLNGENVKIHPSSINSKQSQLPTSYITFYLKQKSTAIFLHDTTCVDEAAIIFAAPKSSIKSFGTWSRIDLYNSLSFRCKKSTAQLIQRLREESDDLFENKILHPSTVNWKSHEGDIMRANIKLICESSSGIYVNPSNSHADTFH